MPKINMDGEGGVGAIRFLFDVLPVCEKKSAVTPVASVAGQNASVFLAC